MISLDYLPNGHVTFDGALEFLCSGRIRNGRRSVSVMVYKYVDRVLGVKMGQKTGSAFAKVINPAISSVWDAASGSRSLRVISLEGLLKRVPTAKRFWANSF